MSMNAISQFLITHWGSEAALGALVYISFVNAIPEKKEDWDTYQVLYHFLRGLTPASRLQQPLKSASDSQPKPQGAYPS